MKLLALATILFLTQAPPQPPKASIEGTVFRGVTTEAIEGARVLVAKFPPTPLASTIPSASTDSQGKFVLKDLDAGSYRLTVMANGFARQEYGTKLPSVQGTPINLALGQTLRDIVVRLLPTGNVTGRISDENARPAVGVTLQLMRATYNANGQRTFQSAGQTRTNDRGEYRLFWVTPGRYYLNAGPGVGPLGFRVGVGDSQNGFQESYTSTFYPGVTDVKAANTIEVQPGIELSGIDLRVTRQQLYKIRGRVIDSTTGERPAAVSLSLSSRGIAETGAFVQTMTQSYNPSDGTFEIKDMMPGTYGITAQTAESMQPGLPRADGPSRPTAVAAVTVSTADVNNVIMTLVMGVSLPGHLSVEGEELSKVPGLDRVRVQLSNVDDFLTGPIVRNPQSQPVSPIDGMFREDNALPGRYRVAVTQLPPDFYLRDARFNQTDVLNGPLQFSGSVSSPLEIVVSARGGQLEGTVTDEKQQPAVGISTVLIPDQYRDRADLYKVAVTDQNGHFLIRGITPGEYKAFAWEALEPFAYFDSELLRRYEALGRSVRIAESDKIMAVLKLIPVTQ